MITYVRFQTPVTLGTETNEWSHDRPFVTAYAGKIAARPGNADLGEARDSIVFEVRIGLPVNHHDVEVPRANIAHITRTPPAPKTDRQESKKP